MTNPAAHHYSYSIDPDGDSTANKILRLVGKQKKVLELGCGPGSMTQFMYEHQECSIIAVEFDAELAKLAESFCERLIVTDLETLDIETHFAKEKFDVIIAADVLEHLRDPWACLRKVRSLLNPGGYLLVSVPNVAHNALISHLLAGRFTYSQKGLLDRTHLRFFTRWDLDDMLLSTGYLPTIWERQLTPETNTEFVHYWQRLPQSIQTNLTQSADGQAYQFIVKAYVSNEAGWVASTRGQFEAMEQQCGQQKEELVQTHTKLDEYIKAFHEARDKLQELESSRHEYATAFHEAREKLQQETLNLEKYANAFHEARDTIEQLTKDKQQLQQALQEAESSLSFWIMRLLRKLKHPRQRHDHQQ